MLSHYGVKPKNHKKRKKMIFRHKNQKNKREIYKFVFLLLS